MNSKSAFFRNDPIALRLLIFYECVDGVSAYLAYQYLCAKIGQDVIDYVEFEFWYMRFARGELDMNYDRSLEPKARSFLDLPVDVHKIIGRELTFADQLIVRNVSKFFKNLIDSWIPDFKKVSIKINGSSTILTLDDTELEFHCYMRRYRYGGITNGYISHWKLALNELFILLKSTKTQLEKLYVKFATHEVIEDKIAAKFKEMDLKINTPIVEIVTGYSNGEMAILPFLEPGELKEIIINAKDRGKRLREEMCQERFTRIGQLEQCQQSEKLTVNIGNCDPNWFPIEGFINCTHFDLHFNSFNLEDQLSISDMLRFRRVLITSSRLNYFHLVSNCHFMSDTLKKRLGKSALEVPNRPDIRHFRIPKSDEYFEMDLSATYNYHTDLTIKRMNGPI